MFSRKKKEINEDFVKDKVAKVKEADVEIAIQNQEQISKKLVNSNFLKKYTELAKIMFGMLKDYKKGSYSNVPWFSIAAIVFSFLYVLNPFDLIPDFIPGLGYIDDFAVFAYALKFIESDLHNYLDWKLEEAQNEDD